jgi:hypothetical protein
MEHWKNIPEYERLYEISDLGNVRSLIKDRILKLTKSRGYLQISLFKNRKQKVFHVHQLVAMAFLEHVPCGMKITVDHINEIKTDNRLVNLQLLSSRENTTRAIDKTKTSSKFLGVYWHKIAKKWKAQIDINGKRKHLGLFHSEEEAAQAYQNVLKKLEADKTM